MKAEQRLKSVRMDIERAKKTLAVEKEQADALKLEVLDIEEKQKESKEQIELIEVWLGELKKNQEDLEKELYNEAKKPKTIWDLGDYDEHYWVSGTGGVIRDTWFGSSAQKQRRDIGNVFLTKQEAEDEARARKLITKARFSEGRKNFDSNSYNWEIDCIYPSDISQSKVTVGDYISGSHANVFGTWETQAAAEKVLYENYEEFKWYFTEYLQQL